MRVIFTYGDKKGDKKSLYSILANVIVTDIEKRDYWRIKRENNKNK